MKKLALVFVTLAAAAMIASGCARATCEKIDEACGNIDIDECMDDYNDGDADCKKAMRDYADCVDDKGCDSEACWDKAIKAGDKC